MLFGDAWERPGLSARDHSLITVAALVEAITHLAFYAGRPKPAARTALAGETRSWRGQHAQGNPVPGAICAC